MKKFTLFAALLLIAAASMFTACKKDEVDKEPTTPPVVEQYLTVEADTVFFSSAAAEGRVVAVDATDNSWMAVCEENDWCKVNTAKNDLGVKEIKIKVSENTDIEPRECTVSVTMGELSAEFVVKQMGMQSDDARRIVLETESYETGFPAGELEVSVVADGTFEVESSASWLVYRGQQAAADGTIKVLMDIEANDDTEPRQAVITFSSRWTSAQATLTQAGYIPLYVSATALKAGFMQDTVSFEVVSFKEWEVSIEQNKTWLTVVEGGQPDVVRLAVEPNPYPIDRHAEVTVAAGSDVQIVEVTQIGAKEFGDLHNDAFLDDVKVKVHSISASSERNATNGVDALIDGSTTTFWATLTNDDANPAWVEASFDPEADNRIDYMVITHTNRLTWGQFGQIEIYAVDRSGVKTKVGEADCGQVSTGSTRIFFEPALVNVASVRIEILTSKRYTSFPNSLQASAAEVEFFTSNPDNFNPLTIFTDMSCTQIRSDVGIDQIEEIDNEFYKSIAEQIYYGVYDQFRICNAEPYPHPSKDADLFRTNTMTLLDNVTGMYIPEAGQEHIILVGDDHGQTITISVIDWVANENLCQNTTADYAISQGRNKIKINHKGLIYVKYHTDNYANLEPVTINFPTASVNGYFDATKHSIDDFNTYFKKATSAQCPHFDMISEKCLLNFAKNTINSSTILGSAKYVSRIADLLAIYDSVFKIQERIQGHDKYKKLGLQRGHRNKALFSTTYSSTYGFSSSYRTAYNSASMAVSVCNPSTLWNKTATTFNNNIVGGIWGLAHELGHSNQTTAFKWIGLTEVTNNLMCAATQTIFYGEGNTTMRFNDHFNKGMRDIVTRVVKDRDGTYRRITHCEGVNTPAVGNTTGEVDPTTRLEPFWQLYMYYHLVLGRTDVYPDFYELCRNSETYPSGTSIASSANSSQAPAMYQLDFMKHMSDAAGEDLSDFCIAWGIPGVNNRMKVTHYGTQYVVTTQDQIDAAAEYCHKYPKPKLNPLYISDLTIDMYRNPQPVTAGTHTYSADGNYSMSGWSGVVAWKLVDPETNATLCIHTPDNSFNFAYQATEYINNSKGDDYAYNEGSSYASSDTGTMRALVSTPKVYYPNALVYGIAADGTEVASLSNVK